MGWIAHWRVKVDDGVECATLQNPGIDLLPNSLPLRRIKLHVRFLEERALEGRYGRPNNSNILLMRARDELAIAGYDVLGAHLFICRSEREAGEQDVVHAQAHENVLDPGLRKDVALESRQPRLPKCRTKWTARNQRAVMQQAISDDAKIQYTQP